MHSHEDTRNAVERTHEQTALPKRAAADGIQPGAETSLLTGYTNGPGRLRQWRIVTVFVSRCQVFPGAMDSDTGLHNSRCSPTLAPAPLGVR